MKNFLKHNGFNIIKIKNTMKYTYVLKEENKFQLRVSTADIICLCDNFNLVFRIMIKNGSLFA